jgi:hypothetical protein
LAYKNPAYKKAASKRHYEANKSRYLERNKRYRQEIVQYINAVKQGTPCADCGKRYPSYVMDFDHLDGRDKDGLVSFFCNTGRIAAAKREIKKCEVVCSNCHRKRTHTRLQKSKEAIR